MKKIKNTPWDSLTLWSFVWSFSSKIVEYFANLTKELSIGIWFWVLGLLLVGRLIQLQIIDNTQYENKLISQHYQHINIQAKRGQIFIESPSWEPIQLTTNINLYDIFIDPKFVQDKPKVVSELTPILLDHFCSSNATGWFDDPLWCLQNLEQFIKKPLLPEKPSLFYLGSGVVGGSWLKDPPATATWWIALREQSANLLSWYYKEKELYQEKLNTMLSGLYYGQVKSIIEEQLTTIIQPGVKAKNFVVEITNDELKSELLNLNAPFLSIEGSFLYAIPLTWASQINKAWTLLNSILSKYQIIFSYRQIKNLFLPQESRYIKIAHNVDQEHINRLKTRKEYRATVKQQELSEKRKQKIHYTQDDMIPLLHGLWFEQKTARVYPFGSFMSHILGYLNKNGEPISGVEEYWEEYLRGKDWQIIWFGAPWINQWDSNDLQLSNPVDWSDITLTIEPNIQKKIELMSKQYLQKYRADSVSILIMNPYDGTIAGLSNAPDFDPNNTDGIYETKPLWPEYAQIVDDFQYMDIPVYIKTWWKLLPSPLALRSDPTLPKFINTNYYGPLALIDKNTSLAYEPGSIFKAITVGIWLDSDEVELYDEYYDKGELQVGDYFIKNVSRACLWTNTFLHALQFSCNIGMIHLIQRIGKYVFYNYLDKLWFGKLTGIEIAWEVPWSIPDSQLNQKSRFFNNSFGQWLLVTPIQMAMAYSTLVNGGYSIKPTLIKKITAAHTNNSKYTIKQTRISIFKDGTSDLIKMALYEVVNRWQIKKFALLGKTLAGKTGTSQIPFRGKYQNGVWWTNGSFAGIVTKENTKYVIVIQVRRPRTSQRWELTAWEIYGELARFLIDYEGIEK